jgi:nucleoside-diphosphate-sugar epimerase
MLKDLVLGASGTIGRWFMGDNIVSVDKDIPENHIGTYLITDLTDEHKLISIFENQSYNKVFQFAADSGKIDYLLSAEHFYGNSTLININILKALKWAKKINKVIWPSSFYRYDMSSPYGLEKKYNEELFKRNLSKEIKFILPILWPTYGPLCDLTIKNEKITTMLCRRIIKANDGDILELKLNPQEGRYFIYITDAIKAIKLMADYDENLILDIGGVEFITFGNLFREIVEISRKDISVCYTSNIGEKRITNKSPDLKTTLSILDWNPETSFHRGMVATYRFIAETLEEWNALYRAEQL